MNENTEKVEDRLAGLEREVINLRGGYVIVNARYNATLQSLSELTRHSADAARRAAKAAELAKEASLHSVEAAKQAAHSHLTELGSKPNKSIER